jgi:hypothetical protein
MARMARPLTKAAQSSVTAQAAHSVAGDLLDSPVTACIRQVIGPY